MLLTRLNILPLILFLAPLTGLMLAAAQETKGKIDPHAAGKINLLPGASEVTYCSSCHKTGCPVPHPELVRMSWQAKARVVLGVNGEISCGTCHTRGFRHRSDAFLARDQKGLCGSCHFGTHSISNAHTSSTNCDSCHIKSKGLLSHATPVETHAMKAGVNSECLRCHFDGPVTHPFGIPNTKKLAPDLPLSADGKITCTTCHIGHNQKDRFEAMLRKDNRRGGLCKSCHDDL